MVPMSFSRAAWHSQLSPEENDTEFLIFSQVLFSKKRMFHMRSLMSKGTCMVRTRVWMLVSSMKQSMHGVHCQHTAIWTNPFRICGEPSSEKQRDTQEALLVQKGVFSEHCLMQPWLVTSPISSTAHRSQRKWYSKDQVSTNLAKILYTEQKTLHSSMSVTRRGEKNKLTWTFQLGQMC